jgi:hypothetical protein
LCVLCMPIAGAQKRVAIKNLNLMRSDYKLLP